MRELHFIPHFYQSCHFTASLTHVALSACLRFLKGLIHKNHSFLDPRTSFSKTHRVSYFFWFSSLNQIKPNRDQFEFQNQCKPIAVKTKSSATVTTKMETTQLGREIKHEIAKRMFENPLKSDASFDSNLQKLICSIYEIKLWFMQLGSQRDGCRVNST